MSPYAFGQCHETDAVSQLEFNLMAIHDDKFPELEAQLQAAQAAGNDFLASELAARIASENEKRSRWAVSNTFNKDFFDLISFSPNSLRLA